jgi:WD domain, G-beta repeat/BTB/POZ domain
MGNYCSNRRRNGDSFDSQHVELNMENIIVNELEDRGVNTEMPMLKYSDRGEEEKIMIKLALRGKIFTVDRNVLLNVSGTYFSGLLSSGVWQPNSDGVYIVDRPSEGFDRILECLSTGKLDCHGLTDNEIDCVYDNLDYFLIPFTRLWDYSMVSQIENVYFKVHLVLHDERVCGETNDCGICIYNMDTNMIEKSMQGHTYNIHVIIQLEDGRICSCSDDGTIKLWNIDSGQCELIIHGHTHHVYCVIQLMDGRLCSGSEDNTIKLWNKDTGSCELTIVTNYFLLSMAQLRDGRICSGDIHGNVNIWNIATGVCDMTLNEHASVIFAITVIDEVRVCGGSGINTIKICNISTGVCEKTLFGYSDCVRDVILLEDGRICSITDGTYGILKIWNIETGVCDLTVRVGYRASKVVQLHDGRLLLCNAHTCVVHIIGG